MKINVPYYSQYLDVTDELWQPRACGVACLKMLLEALGEETPTLDEMIAQGCAIGAHGEYGWKHDGLVALARQYGVKLSRNEWRKSESKTHDELNEEGINFLISELRAGRAVIVSAIKKFQEADKFHMVVLTGFEEKDGVAIGFYYHDSDTTQKGDGENLFVPMDIFRSKWRRMAVF
ncbi:MAG: C39 family peptidase [Minisyncoccia bacterium]